MAGVFQLVLLALGIVDVPPDSVGSELEGPVAVAGPWVGVAVFVVGVSWAQGLRRTSWRWIVVVLYAAYAGSSEPIAVLLARLRLGPPTLVTFLPAF